MRVVRILLRPTAEWMRIAAERRTPLGVLVPYGLILAALGPLAWIGADIAGGYRIAWGDSLVAFGWSLFAVVTLAFVIHRIAPSMDGDADMAAAMKIAVYGATAWWLGAAAEPLPEPFDWLSLFGLYSLVLLWIGTPLVARCPDHQRMGFVISIVVVALLLGIARGMVVPWLVGMLPA
jgi:hypothetical protein